MKYIYKTVNGYPAIKKDCVARAIHFATDIPYDEVYSTLTILGQLEGTIGHAPRSHRTRSSPNKGMNIFTYAPYLKTLGWEYTSFPIIMLLDLLPHTGTIIIHFNRHLATAINGIIYDTWDCRKKKVRGFYKKKGT